MKLQLARLAFSAAFAVFFAGHVIAQETGGVVRGSSNVNVRAGNVNTLAVGSNNVAKTSIGSIKGGAKGGNVTVDVKNVSNVVVGHGKKGCVNIGTKGADPECK